MSVGLIPFVIARLNDDEMLARAATPGPWTDAGSRRDVIVEQVATGAGTPAASLHMIAEIAICNEHEDRRTADAAHIARHDPARALREIEAKRARLALLDEAISEMDRLLADDDAAKIDQGVAIGRKEAALIAVKHDAAVYNEHPGYRAEWKP